MTFVVLWVVWVSFWGPLASFWLIATSFWRHLDSLWGYLRAVQVPTKNPKSLRNCKLFRPRNADEFKIPKES